MKYNANNRSEELARVLAGDGVRDLVKGRADEAAVMYAARAPKRSGHMASSVEVSVEFGGLKMDRWIGVVTVEADYAIFQEYGSRGNPGNRTLSKIVDELDEG